MCVHFFFSLWPENTGKIEHEVSNLHQNVLNHIHIAFDNQYDNQ
jgi:hypothetical protein